MTALAFIHLFVDTRDKHASFLSVCIYIYNVREEEKMRLGREQRNTGVVINQWSRGLALFHGRGRTPRSRHVFPDDVQHHPVDTLQDHHSSVSIGGGHSINYTLVTTLVSWWTVSSLQTPTDKLAASAVWRSARSKASVNTMVSSKAPGYNWRRYSPLSTCNIVVIMLQCIFISWHVL